MYLMTRQTPAGDTVSVVKWDDGDGYGILRCPPGGSPRLFKEVTYDDPTVVCLARHQRMSRRRAAEKTAFALATAL
jgi:hypothetical protein